MAIKHTDSFYFFPHLEMSSLNFFWLNQEDGGRLMIATPSKDIPAPLLHLAPETRYSLRRTSAYREITVCAHEFVLSHTRQIRRGDESESAIYKCTKCGITEIKH